MKTQVKMLGVSLGLAALVTVAIVAGAQVGPAGSDRTIVMDPTEVDTFTIQWESRTLSTTVDDHTVTITPSGPLKNADASPSSIKTGLTVSGSNLNITLSPNSGCGSSGCRKGNAYQIRVQAKDTNNNQPVVMLLLKVQSKVVQG